MVEAESNNRLVESLHLFQDDMDSLNRVTSSKSNADMINRIQKQNATSSEIYKENRELKVCLEDYERAMELIMQKYREHTHSKVLDSKLNFNEVYNEKLWMIIREQRDKINEMAAVMQKAVSMDEEAANTELETMARLRMENKTLRELLQISKQFGSFASPIRINAHLMEEKAVQTDADCLDSADELSLSGASIENANNNSEIHIGGGGNALYSNNSNTALSLNDNAMQNQIMPDEALDNNNGPLTSEIITLVVPSHSTASIIDSGHVSDATSLSSIGSGSSNSNTSSSSSGSSSSNNSNASTLSNSTAILKTTAATINLIESNSNTANSAATTAT